MNYEIVEAEEADKEALVELRISAMKESLVSVGRFDYDRARNRFLESFLPQNTKKILVGDNLAGFYVLKPKEDHLYLDHLYFHPHYQRKGLGGCLLELIKEKAKTNGLPVRVGALRESRANEFYKTHGFSYTHEEEFDIYYEYTPFD